MRWRLQPHMRWRLQPPCAGGCNPHVHSPQCHRTQVDFVAGAAHGADDAGAARANVTDAFRDEAPVLVVLKLLSRMLGGTPVQQLGAPWPALHEASVAELEVISLLKREVRCARALWTAQQDLLSQLDELISCTTTMRLAQAPEEARAAGLSRIGTHWAGSLLTHLWPSPLPGYHPSPGAAASRGREAHAGRRVGDRRADRGVRRLARRRAA